MSDADAAKTSSRRIRVLGCVVGVAIFAVLARLLLHTATHRRPLRGSISLDSGPSQAKHQHGRHNVFRVVIQIVFGVQHVAKPV